MAANLKLRQSTRAQNFNNNYATAATPERYKSVAIELCQFPSRARQKLPIGSVVARAEFGAPGRGCSPTHDGDSIYRKHCRIAILYYEQAVTVANSQLGLEYWPKSTGLRHLDRL